jgi:hypothetical protein
VTFRPVKRVVGGPGHTRVVLVVFVLLIGSFLITACGANDDPFTVTITNDTSQTIVDHTFFSAAYGTPASHNGTVIVVKPGRSAGVTEVANLGTDPDRITSLSGVTLGCLPFQFSENPPTTLDVKVTQMVHCRHWAYEAVTIQVP